MKVIGGMTVRFTDADYIYFNGIKTFSVSKGVIDDILTWSTNLDFNLIYFECICKVFETYCASFRLDKCEFLKDRVEYVGHELTPTGNFPAISTFNMINDWKPTTSIQVLNSFIGLMNFYHNYAP